MCFKEMTEFAKCVKSNAPKPADGQHKYVASLERLKETKAHPSHVVCGSH